MLNKLTEIFKDKKVLVTGHTGFKGAWLSQVLISLGANLTGISLPAKNDHDLFHILNLEQKMDSHIFDLRNKDMLESTIEKFKPDFIFHLAAQALVLDSYEDPYETINNNILSTLNILEILRKLDLNLVMLNVTSDKCYLNNNQGIAFAEDAPLGGSDPYSASKAMVEILSSSYNQSFFKEDSKVKMFTVRAGNVFGGGDWSANRLVPDIVRNIIAKEEIFIRNPQAIRPWQHVLEPINAYLQLAAYYHLNMNNESLDAWNIGPDPSSLVSVLDFVRDFIKIWGDQEIKLCFDDSIDKPYEAKTLGLSSEKIKSKLSYVPKLSFKESLKMTADWYRSYSQDFNKLEDMTLKQINSYFELYQLK